MVCLVVQVMNSFVFDKSGLRECILIATFAHGRLFYVLHHMWTEQQTDRAALLFRQYVKDSLYDRISTRPFLNNIEKKWIAFQLLSAINQCHKLNVCNG